MRRKVFCQKLLTDPDRLERLGKKDIILWSQLSCLCLCYCLWNFLRHCLCHCLCYNNKFTLSLSNVFVIVKSCWHILKIKIKRYHQDGKYCDKINRKGKSNFWGGSERRRYWKCASLLPTTCVYVCATAKAFLCIDFTNIFGQVYLSNFDQPIRCQFDQIHKGNFKFAFNFEMCCIFFKNLHQMRKLLETSLKNLIVKKISQSGSISLSTTEVTLIRFPFAF